MASETITTISPSTNKPVVTRHGPTPPELQAIAQRAEKAFETFSETTLTERQKILKKAIEIMLERQNVLAQELTEQMGRPIAFAAKEITTAVKRLEYMLKVSNEVLAPTEGEAELGFKRYIKKLPVGPVLVLFAWNYPYLILANSIAPAILAGNSIILKPSPQTPTTAEQTQKIFIDAGLPPDVIQVFHSGDFSTIESLISAPQIKLVCFTGSVKGGLAVQKAASDKVSLRVGLELGGKDPAYVRSDVDVDWAAEEIVDGSIFNSGQSCCALERVYVDEKVYDPFIAAVQQVLRGYKLGDPTDKATHIGPVISKQAAKTIAAHVQDALAKGAIDATPENASFASPPAEGNYVSPRLLTNCNHDMIVMKDETFGPIIAVMKVSGDAEAIKLMNDSEFGLTASIWTKDVAEGHALADRVEAGTVFVNRADYPSPDLAWTGWKDSGKGQTLSKHGFDQFVKLKSYHLKDYPK